MDKYFVTMYKTVPYVVEIEAADPYEAATIGTEAILDGAGTEDLANAIFEESFVVFDTCGDMVATS